VDPSLLAILLIGATVGIVFGARLFNFLSAGGQIDFVLKVAFVAALTVVNTLIIGENIATIVRTRKERLSAGASWNKRFRLSINFGNVSGCLIAVIIFGTAATAGFVTTMMGVGGAFLFILVLMFFLDLPRATIVATSTICIIVTLVGTLIVHAITSQTVDAVLASILTFGGVFGVIVGLRFGETVRGELLRLLLGMLVSAVAISLTFDLSDTPDDLWSNVLIR
jgi:uncharacterized membrane protein YfcA